MLAYGGQYRPTLFPAESDIIKTKIGYIYDTRVN